MSDQEIESGTDDEHPIIDELIERDAQGRDLRLFDPNSGRQDDGTEDGVYDDESGDGFGGRFVRDSGEGDD